MSLSWKFSGISASGAPLTGLRVLAFSGRDDICRGYEFDVLLLAGDVPPDDAPDLHQNLMTAQGLALTGSRAPGDSFSWHGAAGDVSRLFGAGNASLFRVLLRPRSFRLSLSSHSRLFLNMTLPQLLDRLLHEEGLTAAADYESKLGAGYALRPLTCQYNESASAFLTRHLERVGGYTYIGLSKNVDELVLADDQTQVEALPGGEALDWNARTADDVVSSFARTTAAGHTGVVLRDYITDQPAAPVVGRASDAGHTRGGGELNRYGRGNLFGEVEIAGTGFSAEDADNQAGKLAAARMRDLVSRANRARGSSTIARLRAGYSFTLDGERFQLLGVRHSCILAGSEEDEKHLRRAADLGFEAGGTERGYRNTFVCHPLELGPFAPECLTPRPVIAGLVHAKVDASGSGKYAELDEQGRYKIKFFFPEKVFAADAEVTQDGNRSIPVRMMQSYAGPNSGIHFPLLKGVEVLTAFTDGDPDRPVILGAVPNPDYPSVVVDKNGQTNVISTPGGNSITMTDTDGSQEIHVKSNTITLTPDDGRTSIVFTQ
jgi:type VI secretion system secreted protein VgrG